MSNFVTVLTDTCQADNNTYIIHTQIYQFVYRVRVFKNGSLVDTIEARSPEPTDSIFRPLYKKAHQKMRMKYCPQNQINASASQQKKTKLLPKPKSIFPKSIKTILLGTIGILLLIFLYKVILVNTEFYINMVYHEPKEKIAYYEQIENKTHILAQKCLSLSRKEQHDSTIFTLAQCRMWCNQKVIDKDTCKLFFAYSTHNFNFHNNAITKRDNPSIDNTSQDYALLPEEDLILDRDKNITIQVNNLGSSSLHIQVEKVFLEKSIYEEIVQFRGGVSNFEIDANKAKKFVIFLEPTYYDQFKKKRYTGYIEFVLFYQGKRSTLRKKFSFVVK